MSEIKHESIDNIPKSHKSEHEGYEYYRRKFVPFGVAKNALVSIYEIPPKKAAYPYHYHHNNEETFYIISGEGILRTPNGERKVSAGDLLFFPTGAEGAHKLTNSSETENLVYREYMDIFSVVFQDFKLLSLKLGENVAGRIDYNKELVTECLEKAGLIISPRAVITGTLTALPAIL